MATKTKTANGATETVENMMAASSDAMKENMEKVVSGFDKFSAFSKENVDAVIQSANAATKGLEAINAEALAFSKQTVEDGVEAAKAVMTAKSVQEIIELNRDFTKTAFDAYVGQLTKMGDMFASAAREAAEPLNGRANAFMTLVQR